MSLLALNLMKKVSFSLAAVLLFFVGKMTDVFFFLFAGEQSAKKESETSPTAAESVASGEAGGEAEGSVSKEKEGETGETTEKAATAPASQGLFSTWNSVVGASFFFSLSFMALGTKQLVVCCFLRAAGFRLDEAGFCEGQCWLWRGALQLDPQYLGECWKEHHGHCDACGQ